ncbi:hypothetical protein ACHWUR_00285 [Klebsiella pneumoniae]
MLKKSFPGPVVPRQPSEMTMLRQIGLLVRSRRQRGDRLRRRARSQQPDYKPLYGSLNGVDANRGGWSALTAADIP